MDVHGRQVLVAEAAAQLDVTPQRVRALLASGDLRGQLVGDVWMIDPGSIANYVHVRQAHAGRALAPVTAWAALLTSFATNSTAELAGTFGIIGKRRARLQALRLREVDDWRWLARRRATVNRYTTRPAYVARLRSEGGVTPAGLSAGHNFELSTGTDTFDAYVDETTAKRLTERYWLRPDSGGNVVLRSIKLTDPAQLELIQGKPLTDLVIAVDLFEDRDPRTAAAGRDLLATLIDQAQSATR